MGVAQPIVVGRLHRQRDQWLVVGEPGRLHVAEDGILAVSDTSNLENRRRALSTSPKRRKLAERALGDTVVRMDQPLDHHLGMGRDLEVDGVTLDHLDVLSEHTSSVLELIEVLVPA